MRLFADDSILYRDIHDPRDHETLVADINTLHDWAKHGKWTSTSANAPH